MAVTTLPPYSGNWDTWSSSHLLRRATMGPTYQEIIQATEDGLEATLDALLDIPGAPDPPLLHVPGYEPDVAFGETWVNTPHPEEGGQWRSRSFRAWFFGWLNEAGSNVHAQMTFFWINHFAVADIHDHRSNYQYIKLLQDNCLGNAREIVKLVTVSTAMLEFQNGNVNEAENPNENYARELLELFSIQKGEQIAPGDYSNYSEQDVVAIARALTGWRIRPFHFSPDDIPVESYFNPRLHDNEPKQLSYHFNNAVIAPNGADEYKDVIDIIFAQRETAYAITRELYRFFMDSVITEATERDVIAPLATLLYDSDYEMKPVMRALLGSAHFFDVRVTSAKVKNPAEFILSIVRPMGEFRHLEFPSLQERYDAWMRQQEFAAEMEMKFYGPPSVAGWEAYHQAPSYHRSWATTVSLQQRQRAINEIVQRFYGVPGFETRLNIRGYLESLSNPEDVNAVVHDSGLIFLPRPLSQQQFQTLKEYLLFGGTSDIEWTFEYNQYLNTTESTSPSSGFERHVFGFLRALFGMLEFHLV